MSARANSRLLHSTRYGLAPLEMVMVLPILLFMAALIVNFGISYMWSVRALSVSRHATWSSRRDGILDDNDVPTARTENPESENWWQYWHQLGGSIGSGSPGPIDSLADPRVDHPVVRGPMIESITVNRDLLDPARGQRRGTAEISRKFPIMTKFFWKLTKKEDYRIKTASELLDNKWQFHDTGLGHNNQRRTDQPEHNPLYQFPSFSSLENAYAQAIWGAYSAHSDPAFDVMDREEDFVYYPPIVLRGGGHPDFYPRLKKFCSLDRSLADERVEDLIDRIQGRPETDDEKEVLKLPESMCQRFKRFYEGMVREMEEILAMDPPPPPPDYNLGAIRAEIPGLKSKISILESYQTYLDTLP